MAVLDALDPDTRVASLTPPPPAPAEPPPAPAEPPVAPAAPAEEVPASARLPGISPQTNQAIEDFAARAKRQADLAEQGQAAMAPLIDAQIKRLGQPLPTPVGPVQQPQVPKREEVMSGVEQALMGLATFGAIIGGRGRTHATNAMAAMTGAIEGLSEGSKEKFDQNVKIYELESKRAQEIYQEQRNQFLDTIQNRTLGENEMKMQLALMSQRYNDPAMQQSLGNLKDTATLFEGRDRLLNELKEYDLGLRGTLYRMSITQAADPETIELLAARQRLGDDTWKKLYSNMSGVPAAVTQLASSAAAISPEIMDRARDIIRNRQMLGAQQRGLGAFAAGPEARLMRSQNVAVQHLDVYAQAAEALHNGDVPGFNAIRNYIQAQLGRAAPTNFETVKGIVADEVVKGVIGGAGALADREGIARQLRAASSPEQFAGQLRYIKWLLAGQVKGLRQQFITTTGQDEFEFERRLLPETRRALEELDEGAAEPPSHGLKITVTPDPARYGTGVRSIEVVP